jgi:hypothetical protein
VAGFGAAPTPRVLESRGSHIGETIEWERIDLRLNYPLLGRLQEKVRGVVRVEIVDVEDGDTVLATAVQELELLAPNEFRFEPEYWDPIAAFVFPTDPYVLEIMKKTRQLLLERTGDSSTEGYQSGPMRVRQIANAVYDAMSSMGYDYSNPQGYFDPQAQRVRTPTQIKQENCATCLDSAVLMAACFAQAGLEPVVFLVTGHAFAGYFTGIPIEGLKVSSQQSVDHWMNYLGQNRFSQLLRGRDYQEVRRLLGDRHIQPVETTTTTQGSTKSFVEACNRQNGFSVDADPRTGTDDSTLNAIVVVRLAWAAGITPPVALTSSLPTNIEPWSFREIADTPIEMAEPLDLDDPTMSEEEKAIPPRVRQWMASLLDLGSRNPLLKIKAKQMMEFDVPASVLGTLDDLLHIPKGRIKLPSFTEMPRHWIHNGVTDEDFNDWSSEKKSLVFPSYKEFNSIQSFAESRLRAIRSDKDNPNQNESDATIIEYFRNHRLSELDASLAKAAKKQIANADAIMLATGNNSLYLALGTLSWTEQTDFRGKKTSSDWCAPLYLYPVILEGGKGTPWTLRLDPKSEITPNYCLHEKLRRPPYNIDLQELVNPEEDQHGINLDKMMKAIKQRLATARLDNFAVESRAVLGAFNYSSFRLWKDLRDDWRKMAEISPVFKHIAYTSNVPYMGNPPAPDPRLEPLLPIAADDSQRRAVQKALDGQSFKLEGPPGTGKSQTITNLLASCIAHNKKVLFVAEKQTALDAVKGRLDKAGLGLFSLNLHAKGDSDTKLRKNIADALNSAMNATSDPADIEWSNIEVRLNSEQDLLDRYRRSLHEPDASGFSAWDANERLLEAGDGPLVDVPLSLVADFAEAWPTVRDAVMAFNQALDLVPDTATHPWRFVGHAQMTDMSAVGSALSRMLDAARRLPRSEGGDADRMSITAEGLATAAVVARLSRDGLRPPAEVLDASDTGVIDAYESRIRAIFAEARSQGALIAPHLAVVGATFFERDDHDDLRAFLMNAEPSSIQALLEPTERVWLEIVGRAVGLPNPESQTPIQLASLAEVTALLDAAESSTDSAEFAVLVQQLRGVRVRVGELAGSISAAVLSRDDVADLEFRAKDAIEAGVLARGKKMKALRDLVGPIASTSDDRLLANAVLQAVPLIREWRTALDGLRARFPELAVDPTRVWSEEGIAQLEGALLRVRTARLRELGIVAAPPVDDRQFLAAVRVLVDISPMAHTQMAAARSILPDVDIEGLRPWLPSEFERLRSMVADSMTRGVVSKLGTAGNVVDTATTITSLKAVLAAADRVAAFRRDLVSAVFPDLRKRFDLWDTAHVDDLERAALDVVAVLRSLSGGSRWIARSILGDAATEGESSAVVELAAAWGELASILPVDSAYFAGRSVAVWVIDEVPALLEDAGPYGNSFVLFNRWQSLQSAAANLKALGFELSVPALMAREYGSGEFLIRVRRTALTKALRIRMEAGNLDAFDRKAHEQRIRAFENALDDARHLLARRIPGLAASRYRARKLPSGAPRGATQDLLKGLNPKKGDKTPIRELISKYGTALADAMPCFLMSPDSVASLLPVGSIEFDVVVFDEASQIRTPSAMGALGRGKAGIVVGDSRQMPPSNTFSSNAGAFVVDDDDHDESEAVDDGFGEGEDEGVELLTAVAGRDAESILSEYDDSKLPEMQLLCHYRSKDEVLIAFSNSFVYPEPMLTFPSPAGLESTSLRFVHVPDGRFERDKQAKPYLVGATLVQSHRTNRQEADLIVAEVVNRLRDPQRRARREADPERIAESIIVVTFNVPQMNLITELLRSADQALAEKALSVEQVDEDTERPPQVKVRNVENVQGDEAETVIFSVAFSKNDKGKLPLNFGPVTNPGGERRLNVAVTRAHREMIVYASFLPEEMTPGNKEIRPEAKLVQQFLKLAQKGADSVGDVGIGVRPSRHIEQIADEIRGLGFEVYTQLGLSTLRVDLALRRPGADRWEIAVMVDDTCWSDRGSAFQREILPRQVLPRMGWKHVFRIWLPSWKNSKREILDELARLLEEADEIGIDEMCTEDAITAADSTDDMPHLTTEEESDESDLQQWTAPVVQVEHSRDDDDFEVFVPFSGKGEGGPDVLYALGKDPRTKAPVLAVIAAVLEAEAPVEANRFGKLVCHAFGFGRVTPDRVEQLLNLVPAGQIHSDVIGRFVWREERQWETWTGYRTSVDGMTRRMHEISSREFRNALVDFVQRSHSMNVDDLVRELATSFGVQKLSAAIKTIIETAVEDAIITGAVRREGDTLYHVG